MLRKLIKDTTFKLGVYYPLKNFVRRDAGTRLVSESQEQFYATLIGRDDTVFDVGANVGQRSAIFSRLCAKVVAVEPQPKCIEHLKSRFKFSSNVFIENAGLGEEEGEAILYECDTDVLSSMSVKHIKVVSQNRFKGEQWNRGIAVRVTTVERLIAKYGLPKFIKIDVEGYELNVLRGLHQAVPFVSFEFTPELSDEAEQCVRWLNELSPDYLYNYCLGENLSFVLSEHVSCQTMVDEVLPRLQAEGNWGDLYAIHKPTNRA